MSTELSPVTAQDQDLQNKRRYGSYQYQYQTLTLHNSLGLVFMSALALALLIALFRQQARYQELIEKLAQKQ
jgi:hypothetical protein